MSLKLSKLKALDILFKTIGYPSGILVRLKKKALKVYPNMYFYYHPEEGALIIPSSLFIGEIVERSPLFHDCYYIRWWADKREGHDYCFVWDQSTFELVKVNRNESLKKRKSNS